jgi:hypothetical protein
MIIGFIRGQRLVLSSPPLTGGSYEALSARFVFETGEWDGLVRFAHFRREAGEGASEETAIVLPLSADGSISEHLNLAAGRWQVWVHGDAVSTENGTVTARRTTDTAFLTVKETGAEDPLPLPPTYGEQVLAQVISVKEQTMALLDEYEEAFIRLLAFASDEINEQPAGNATVGVCVRAIFNLRDNSRHAFWSGTEEQYAAARDSIGAGTICLVGVEE